MKKHIATATEVSGWLLSLLTIGGIESGEITEMGGLVRIMIGFAMVVVPLWLADRKAKREEEIKTIRKIRRSVNKVA